MSGTKLISCVSLALLGGLLCCSAARAGFLVGDKTGGNIYQYTDAGAFVGLWATVTGNPTQIDYNPVDGKVYVNTSTGIKRYSAAGVFEANLGNTVTNGMSVDTVTGDIYTAKTTVAGTTGSLFKIATPSTTPTESVANTLTGSINTGGGTNRSDHSFSGALDVSRQAGETGATGEVVVYDDTTGPDELVGLNKSGTAFDSTSVTRSQTIFGTATVVNRTFAAGIHTGNLQNNGSVSDVAMNGDGSELYFAATGGNKLEAVRNGNHGGWFDSGTSPGPAGGGVGAFGTFVDTTTGIYGQISYNGNDGSVYYVIDNGGSLAEVRKLNDGSSSTSPTWTTDFSVDAQVGSGQAWGVAFLPTATAPEPSTFVLGAMGMLGLAFAARRRRDAIR